MESILIGLAVGNGTGSELMAAFEKVSVSLASPYKLQVCFHKSPRIYHSYSSLLAVNDVDVATEETLIDAGHYESFCREAKGLGACAIFRTSMSAQALYQVRDRLQAVKVEHFELSPSTSLLLVRDQAQGFYSGTNVIDSKREIVHRASYFAKPIFERVLAFSISRARELWGPDVLFNTVTLVYKFHLFDGLFHSWAQEWSRAFGVAIEFVQGDTMNRNLLAFGLRGHRLLIAANEYADIMQTILLDRFGLGAQEAACAENVYLSPSVGCLSEYQTAHGSADDLVGKGTVNPSATIRAVAALLEQYGRCSGIRHATEAALKWLHVQHIRTPDQNGPTKTVDFVDAFLHAILPTLPMNASRVTVGDTAISLPGRKSCLLVMDFQNDFIAQYKAPQVMVQLKETVPRVIEWARRTGIDVAFVRFLGDEKYQPQTWRYRNQTQQRQPWCVEESWGAEIASCVQVHAQDRVFDKKAYYDPFLSADFAAFAMQFDHLIVVGLFADVCIDAAVRSAFQRGLWTTLIRECTAALHLAEEQSFALLEAVCGCQVLSMDQLFRIGRDAKL